MDDCHEVKTIGIVGGMGPASGIDLAKKIVENTEVTSDQEHIPMLLASYPCQIGDRTEFLQGKIAQNPAHGISDVICQLEAQGAEVVGMPCNTAHAAPIFDKISELLERRNSQATLVHMVRAVAEFLTANYSGIQKVGLLSTIGTCKADVYPNYFKVLGIHIIMPDKDMRDHVHQAIYNPGYGIKAISSPIKDKARTLLYHAIDYLADQHAQAVILGCTEIELAIPKKRYNGAVLIHPTDILARELIRLTDPQKLKPFTKEDIC